MTPRMLGGATGVENCWVCAGAEGEVREGSLRGPGWDSGGKRWMRGGRGQ